LLTLLDTYRLLIDLIIIEMKVFCQQKKLKKTLYYRYFFPRLTFRPWGMLRGGLIKGRQFILPILTQDSAGQFTLTGAKLPLFNSRGGYIKETAFRPKRNGRL